MVKARLRGRAAEVRDATAAGLTAAAGSGERIELTLGGTGESALAQVTAYHAITATRTFLVAAGFPAEDLGAPVTATVDVSGSCNAYYDPGARAFSFFRSGAGCQNSAEASIVAHEYGHFVDDAYGGILDDGLSEGWGDVLACLSRGTPVVGPDLMPGELVRTCDNDYVFPVSGEDEMHALGQAWSGFVWHARAALMTQLGAAHGDALIRTLVLPSLVSNAADIPSAVREVFLRDDDDGSLGNRTPHWAALWAAAERHGLTFALEGDAIAPDRVHDLGVVGVDETSAKLRWTAPGDDGANGAAAAYYDLRTSPVPLTEATFAQATRVPAPDPIAPGATQGATIPLVPGGGAVYVGLRTIDDAGNQSALSNVVRVEPAAADVIFSDGAESGLGDWHVTGLWHITSRRAVSGGHAFWYGDEARGNFHTGSRTTGTLSSPVIDLAGVERPAVALAELLDVELATKFDLPTITVRDVDDGSIAVTLRKDGGSTAGAFRTRVLDLSVLAGRRVRIELAFDSVDGKANKGEGWFVDDVRVVGVRGAATVARGLVINEVLADPPSGWDSGGDGVAATLDDECLELVNAGDAALDVSGWTIADAVRTRVTIPDGTVIAPGDCLLVLGGGAAQLPGVATVIAEGGLSLNNGGDTVRIRRPAGELAVELGWGGEGGHDSALVRQMDGDAESPMVRHADLVPAPASPGRRTDGSPWRTSSATLVINEILADPPAGYDASGDGVASTTSDEFVELVNAGTTGIDLGGATISDGLLVRATLPPGTMLAPGKALAVFGGAAGLALNNGGDTVTIASSSGALLATVTYGTEGGHDQSLVRTHDGQSAAPFIGHLSLSTAPASPGRHTDGAPF
jgi:hypothetical protein